MRTAAISALAAASLAACAAPRPDLRADAAAAAEYLARVDCRIPALIEPCDRAAEAIRALGRAGPNLERK